MDYPDNFVSISEEIFVMGYPYGWYDKVNNLQITRVGHLATPFKVPYVDLTEGYPMRNLGKDKIVLIGINSGQFQLPSEDPKERPNLICMWFSK